MPTSWPDARLAEIRLWKSFSAAATSFADISLRSCSWAPGLTRAAEPSSVEHSTPDTSELAGAAATEDAGRTAKADADRANAARATALLRTDIPKPLSRGRDSHLSRHASDRTSRVARSEERRVGQGGRVRERLWTGR